MIIDGVEYVQKDRTVELDGMPYRIVRCQAAGVFAGYVESEDGDVYVLCDARRLWYWSGAASLSQLANEGVKSPDDCKFPAPVSRVKVFGVIEVLEPTAAAKATIDGVPEWRM